MAFFNARRASAVLACRLRCGSCGHAPPRPTRPTVGVAFFGGAFWWHFLVALFGGTFWWYFLVVLFGHFAFSD